MDNQSRLIQSRYRESWNFLQPRKQRQASQLVLLNNQQRPEQSIGSTLLVTLLNRVVSSLYDDKLQVKFLPSQGINQDQLNAFNVLAQSDYIEMDKAKLDYDWCWDTLFFGRGYMETLRFDKERKIMSPHVINPLVMGYDPYFEEVQDWRYYWKWVTKSKVEINRLIKAGVITGVTKAEQISPGIDSFLWTYKTERDAAKLAVEPSIDPVDADVFQILEFYGYDDAGDKCVYWIDRDFSKVLMKKKLDLADGTPITAPDGTVVATTSKWPIVVKEAFREPHSSVNFSVADLLEDKQRAKAVLLNLAFVAAKDKANPLYGYNPDKVRDITQFFSRQLNQHIPMDDESAVWPLNKEDPMSPGLLQFISMLTTEANEPIGTGTVLQPESKSPDTATEAAIDQQLNDMAQSILSKIMQFGEQEFWSHWFHRYQQHADALGSKMANVVGVKGVTTQEIDLKSFKTNFPPGVYVFSAKEAEYKTMVKRRELSQLYPMFAQTLDADGMRNFNKHVFVPLYLDDPSLIDVMLPKTLSEIKAEGENERLAKDEMPDVSETDDHTTHIYTHMMVQPKTKSTWFHIAWHEELLAQQKAQEQAQAQQEMVGKPQPGTERMSPKASASPLKTELTSNAKK